VKTLIKELVEAYGPSGDEGKVREIIRRQVEPLCDECRVDVMGSLIARKKGSGGGIKVMLAGHMDEIGVIVTHVDDKGFLRFGSIGGVNPLTVVGGRVLFANGVRGTINREYPKSPDEKPSLDKMYIDVGATNKAELTVGVGDTACFDRPLVDNGKRLIAKAFDDRIACAIMVQTLKELKQTPHDVSFVFTVQEELGLRGAATSAFSVAPDMAIAVDVTLAADTPEAPYMNMTLGRGPCIKVKDGGSLAHPGVKNLLIETAKRLGIPYQLEVLLAGTTDATAIQLSKSGVAAGTVSVATRYVHSPSEMVDYQDVLDSVKLLVGVLSAPIKLG
jgi:tetrahedral aminopeptidase